LRANRPAEALEEAKLAARRDPRLFLPPVLETLAHVALGQADAAKISLVSARQLRPELTLREIEISHGRRAVKALADLRVRSGSMLSKKGLSSRANSDSCLGGGRRFGDDGAAGPRSGAALLRV
jgi:hypothetical protein